MEKNVVRYESPLGTLECVFDGEALIGVSIVRPGKKSTRGSSSDPGPNDAALAARRLGEQLEVYFSSDAGSFDLPIRFLEGTEFERSVWRALKEVPRGEVRSYQWLAERIGSPKAARAVGQALGKNPLPIVLPCHRILRSDGSLGGFSGGLEIKRRLLELEGVRSVASGMSRRTSRRGLSR